MTNEKHRRAFISYSRVNKEFATKLTRGLKAAGFPVWFDVMDIPTGARWDDEVEKALRECSIFMIILTPASIASENVKDEIGYAIDHGKRILPILLEDCDVPLRLRRFQYVDFTTKSFEDGFESAKELLGDLVDEVSVPTPTATQAETPATSQLPPAKKAMPKSPMVESTSSEKKPVSKGLMIGLGTVALSIVAIIGFNVLRGGGRETATEAPVVVPATPSPAVASSATQAPATVNPPTETQAIAIPVTGTVLFQDDFSDTSIWNIWTNSDNKTEYSNNALKMIFFTQNLIDWIAPNDNSYDNVHLETTVMTNNSDPSSGFGLMCNLLPDDHSYYYFMIKSTGEYAIALAVAGPDVFLTNNDHWATSDLITRNASSYRLGADCGSDGVLTLYVDGQKIDSVSDSTYTKGRVGLIALSGEDATKTDISFDDFLVTALK